MMMTHMNHDEKHLMTEERQQQQQQRWRWHRYDDGCECDYVLHLPCLYSAMGWS
jgi:hypothetical protein